MNFQNMQYFLTVVEEKNITKASERLNLSQQALSNHIARIEEELGCKLFERRQPLELTYSGRVFLDSCTKILDIHKQMSTAIDDVNHHKRGELRIGISYTRGQAILPLILPSFSKRYPDVELFVLEGSTEELEESLKKGEIDVMIGFAPFMLESAVATPLMTEHLYLVLPNELLAKHFGDRADEVYQEYLETNELSLFKDLPYVLLKKGDRIRKLVDAEFKRLGWKPNIKIETSSTQTGFALAAEGMGLTVCPELYLKNRYLATGFPEAYCRQKVRLARFFSGNTTDTIAIGYSRDRYLSHIAEDFIKMSIEAMEDQSFLL